MKKNIISLAILKAKIGSKEKLQKELLKLVEKTNNEEGCIEYSLYEDKNESHIFYMWEKFKDTHAVKIHDESPHYKKFESQMNDLIQEPIQLIELGKVLN